MDKKILDNVTLVGIDCLDVDRLSFAAQVCQKNMGFADVKLLSSLPTDDPNLVTIDPITCIEDYSYFVAKKLYKYIETDFLLIFQYDGFILNPNAWSDDFLNYDYIGAQWPFFKEYKVGNGGFSLRTKELMTFIAKDDVIFDLNIEDHSICRTYGKYLMNHGFNFAPVEVADRFSTEGKWSKEFGFHSCDISDWRIFDFVDPEVHSKYIKQFFNYFPKAKQLYNME